jgi:mRNA interferase MazF
MKVSRGDVVLVGFPFSIGAAQKLRPTMVVQNDSYNRRLATTILAPITSNIRHAGDPAQVPVDPSTIDGSRTGLLRPSAIKCENLATVETRLIRRRIGNASASLLNKLEAALKVSLSLS